MLAIVLATAGAASMAAPAIPRGEIERKPARLLVQFGNDAPLELEALMAPKHLYQWRRYLESADHKAFAISPSGRFAWRSGRYAPAAARTAALEACALQSCRLYAHNDTLATEEVESH